MKKMIELIGMGVAGVATIAVLFSNIGDGRKLDSIFSIVGLVGLGAAIIAELFMKDNGPRISSSRNSSARNPRITTI